MNDRPYWHEIPQQEVDKLIEQGVTVQFVKDNFKQPEWCGYHDALCPMMGCWSLTGNEPGGSRTKISVEFCKECDLFNRAFALSG